MLNGDKGVWCGTRALRDNAGSHSLFVSGDADFVLSKWVAGLKRAISKAVGSRGESWQPTFFVHILRSDESYSEKWEYVYENPVRAGLVKVSDEWKYQGEVVLIDRV